MSNFPFKRTDAYGKPLDNKINSWQIDAALQMHQLTTNARIPRRSQPPAKSVQPAQPSSTYTDVSVPAIPHEKCNNPVCEQCGAVIIPAPAATFPLRDTPSISVKDWRVFTARNPILNAGEIEQFESILHIPVPEMIFGNNKVEVVNEKKGVHVIFNALDALKTVSVDPKDFLKVSYANEWFTSRQQRHEDDSEVVMEVFKPYDWTYTAHYKGTDLAGQFARDDSFAIPTAKLTRKDPILFFDNMTLFEDELGDNGITSLSIKIRVMHDCLLVLQRLFVRVDDVLVRIHDTRLYVDFVDGLVVREFKRQQQDYHELERRNYSHQDPKKLFRDIQWCSQTLPVVGLEREYMRI